MDAKFALRDRSLSSNSQMNAMRRSHHRQLIKIFEGVQATPPHSLSAADLFLPLAYEHANMICQNTQSLALYKPSIRHRNNLNPNPYGSLQPSNPRALGLCTHKLLLMYGICPKKYLEVQKLIIALFRQLDYSSRWSMVYPLQPWPQRTGMCHTVTGSHRHCGAQATGYISSIYDPGLLTEHELNSQCSLHLDCMHRVTTSFFLAS